MPNTTFKKTVRLALATHLVVMGVILAGMPSGSSRGPSLPDPAEVAAALPAPPPALAAMAQQLNPSVLGTARHKIAPPPQPEPDAAADAAAGQNALSQPALDLEIEVLDPAPSGAWSPPTWFPEDTRRDLWALEGIDGQVDGKAMSGSLLHSRAAFVYDLDRGAVLLTKRADERWPVASLTKIVSALAVMSEGEDLDRPVCLDSSMKPSWPGAVTRLRYGSCTSAWDLLGAALVHSDNGAAMALSAATGLPAEPFVARMNEVARELGMSESSFADPSGAQDENLSTAREMTRAIVATALHPVLSSIATAPWWDVEYDEGPSRRMWTTNRMLGEPGLEWLAAKTGYTDTARHCFTGVVRTADGRTLAVTTLGAGSGRQRWEDVRKLITWAREQDKLQQP